MPSAIARAHRAVWVCRPHEEQGRVVRVTWVENTPLCFGDGSLADLEDRERVFVDVGTGSGTLQDEFAARVRVLAPEVVPHDAIVELLEHVSLGRTPDEVAASLARHRERRLLALEPPGEQNHAIKGSKASVAARR